MQATAPAEGWTPNSHWVAGDDAMVTRSIYPGVTFHSDGEGNWEPVSSAVTPLMPEGVVTGARAEHAVRPVTFGSLAKSLVTVPLDGGTVTLSARGLSIAAPSVAATGVSYHEVAPSTRLDFEVTNDGLKSLLVLDSPEAPKSFRFHLSDPDGALGLGSPTADGGFSFDRPVADGLRLELGSVSDSV